MNPNKAALRSAFSDPSTRPNKLISLTPLIDVVFILLVFFMLASSFLDWRIIELDSTRKSAASGTNKPTSIVVRVAANHITIDDDKFKLAELVERVQDLQTQQAAGKILLKPVDDVKVQRLINVLDHLNAAGIKQLSLFGRASGL